MATKKAGTKAAGKKKTTAVTKQKVNAVTKSAAPDYIQKEDADLNIQPGELSIPFIKLLQATSGEVNCEAPLGAAGEYYNTATEEVIGTELYFIPVLLNRKRIMWNNFDDGGGMACRSYDNTFGNTFGECALCRDEETGVLRSEFGPAGEKPLCTKYYDFVSIVFPANPKINKETKIVSADLLKDFSTGSISLVSFGTTKVKAAKRLIMIAQNKKVALYANVFKMTTKFVRDKNNNFYVPELEWFGWVDPFIYKSIQEDIENLKTIAGNPEAYTQDEDLEGLEDPREDMQGEEPEDAEYYEAGEDDAEDLPF